MVRLEYLLIALVLLRFVQQHGLSRAIGHVPVGGKLRALTSQRRPKRMPGRFWCAFQGVEVDMYQAKAFVIAE